MLDTGYVAEFLFSGVSLVALSLCDTSSSEGERPTKFGLFEGLLQDF